MTVVYGLLRNALEVQGNSIDGVDVPKSKEGATTKPLDCAMGSLTGH